MKRSTDRGNIEPERRDPMAVRPAKPVETPRETARDEHTALGWAALAAVVTIAWLVAPIGVGLLMGTLLAFMAQPLFERLRPRLGVRGSVAVTMSVSIVTLAAALGGLGWLFVARGTALSRQLITTLGPRGTANTMLDEVGHRTARIGIPPDALASHARALADRAASSATDVAKAIVSAAASAGLGLFFTILAMHFILCNWQVVLRRAKEAVPLRPEYTEALFSEFRRVGRTTMLGTVVTGLAQGVFASIGYWMAGVPEPLFFGAATAVASLVPAVGTLLVWVPAGVILIVMGHVGRGVLELVWSLATVIGVCDYVIRPRLVRGGANVPSVVTFAALFGGVEVFGLKGLIVGPVVMALAMAVLQLYGREARNQRQLAQKTNGAHAHT